MARKIVHSIATALFTLLEVTGIPRVKDEPGGRGEG
jgi:hypothetical protein